jgi:hypothetical protein
VAGVSESSKLVRSFVKPALHVGKQIAGGAGCCACTGSGGIAGGATAGPGKLGETLAQPLASISGTVSISASLGKFRFSLMDNPFKRGNAPLFLNPGRSLGSPSGLGRLGHHNRKRGLGQGMVALLIRQAPRLHPHQDERPGQRNGQAPGHLIASLVMTRSMALMIGKPTASAV